MLYPQEGQVEEVALETVDLLSAGCSIDDSVASETRSEAKIPGCGTIGS